VRRGAAAHRPGPGAAHGAARAGARRRKRRPRPRTVPGISRAGRTPVPHRARHGGLYRRAEVQPGPPQPRLPAPCRPFRQGRHTRARCGRAGNKRRGIFVESRRARIDGTFVRARRRDSTQCEVAAWLRVREHGARRAGSFSSSNKERDGRRPQPPQCRFAQARAWRSLSSTRLPISTLMSIRCSPQSLSVTPPTTTSPTIVSVRGSAGSALTVTAR